MAALAAVGGRRRTVRAAGAGTAALLAVVGGAGAGLARADPGASAAHVAGGSAPTRTSSGAACVKTVVAAGDMDGVASVRDTGELAVHLNPELVTVLGDEQYPSGSLADFRLRYAKTGWGALKARTRPVPGNHEYQTPGAAGYFAYFNHPPTYYAYDAGCGWRAYALNSEVNLRAEANWLRRDLATHRASRLLAYWHRPFLSSGSAPRGNPRMVALWREFLNRPTIVLNGHIHNYERFAPRHGISEFVVGTAGNATHSFRAKSAPGSAKRIGHTPGVLLLHLRIGSYTWSFRNTSDKTLDAGSG